jgi:hypothetical protein
MDVGIVVEFVFLAVVASGLSVAWRLAVEPHDVTLDLVVAESGVVGRSAGQPASE